MKVIHNNLETEMVRNIKIINVFGFLTMYKITQARVGVRGPQAHRTFKAFTNINLF